jgi:hypothetical protein
MGLEALSRGDDFATLRHGPTEAAIDESWGPGDIEKVK